MAGVVTGEDARGAYVLPYLFRTARGFSVHRTAKGPTAGFVEYGPNMHGWGWTVGFGWHTGLPTLGAALDALLADPAFGVDVHGTADKDGSHAHG